MMEPSFNIHSMAVIIGATLDLTPIMLAAPAIIGLIHLLLLRSDHMAGRAMCKLLLRARVGQGMEVVVGGSPTMKWHPWRENQK
jgi:hypothetical protein